MKWTRRGGDLSDVLGDTAGAAVRTSGEASAICAALDAYRADPHRGGDQIVGSPLHTLAAFFQKVDGSAAFNVLRTEGLPRLRPWVEDALSGKDVDKDDLLFILKILAMYRQAEDLSLLVRAARHPLHPDEFMWSVIFGQFDAEHPHSAALVSALHDPLPEGFILVAFLDLANTHAIAGTVSAHPFNTQTGWSKLRDWLTDLNEDHFSYARSATAALPFIDPAQRHPLLLAAQGHPDLSVQLEAAWAQVKAGDDSGLPLLTRYASDPRYSHAAQPYLDELGRADHIPAEARDPDFQALSEMSSWLSNPNEFGRFPTALELFDTRVLFWPPTDDRRRVWLVKYTYRDNETAGTEMGIGMVGSVTFGLFGENTADLTPEALYGLHCSWELEQNDDPRAPEARSASEGIRILREHGNTLSDGPKRTGDA